MNEEIIFAYTDEQALEDGVLVDTSQILGCLGINRVTRAVWDAYVTDMGGGIVQDITRLKAIAEKVKSVKPDDGWYVYKIGDVTLWCIPNEANGLTLMLPEDY